MLLRLRYEVGRIRRQPTPLLTLLRRWFWIFVCHWETEICDECGGRVMPHTDSWWTTDDALWIEITEPEAIEEGHNRRIGNGVLCPPCFTKAAREKGIWIHWQAVVEQ